MPGNKEGKCIVLWRKFALTGLGVLCPEIMTTTAVGQWVRARKCVQAFNSVKLEQELAKRRTSQPEEATEKSSVDKKEVWTMEMAFFADMGGFRLRTTDQDSFPVDATQLYYLVERGYVKLPIYKPRLIDDKNKVDVLLRTIIICQISWFLIGVIGRWVQRLFVTTAELTTVSFILCSAVTTGFWWHKPADVVMAEIIDVDVDTTTIFDDAGIAPHKRDDWRMTPLDFVGREEWWWSRGPISGVGRSRISNFNIYRRIAKAFKKLDKAMNGVRNNSPDRDKDLTVPLRVLLPVYLVGFFYCSCRTYIMIADIIELRSLPPSAYESVKWEKFWPHLG
ncbi:MAG: hypothetical protein Q9222_001315 [Ikaeria aurantiellina]